MTCPESYLNFLVDQTPHFDEDIIRSINPQASMIGKVETATWPSFKGNTHTYDRFHNVYANPTREWVAKEYAECEGNPCAPDADEICWGNSRETYFKEQRNIKTKVLCFDQIRDVSHAKEHTAQIIADILRPATNTIMSGFIRKRMWDHSGRRWVANSTMSAVGTSTWVASGNDEIFWDTDVDPATVFKLTPQMLMRRVQPLARYGYFQNMVFNGFPNMIELRTDLDTCWDLDKQVTNAALQSQWRFQQWDAANAFWKFGLSGQLGNFAVDTDFDIIRFNYYGLQLSGLHRYQVVLPYRNVAADNGLQMEPNPDFDNAQYQFSQIWHRKAAQLLVADASPVNPEMPFGSRNLAGEWKFAMDDLGCENFRKNLGLFYADFELAWKPRNTEWAEGIFHKREPQYVIEIDTCASDPGYPEQYYTSACDDCPVVT